MKLIEDYITLPRVERLKHVDLSDRCIERGGNSTVHKGVLAQYLDTTIPSGWSAILCHKCNNDKCSNPKHLYWGTCHENNVIDQKDNGTYQAPHLRVVAKYGEQQAKLMLSENGKKYGCLGGRAGKGKPKSEKHRRKLSEASKLRNSGT